MDPQRCRLQDAAGRVERCSANRCQFWQDGACLFQGIDPELERSLGLAQHLLELRHELDQARLGREPGARTLFFLSPGDPG